MTVVDLLNDILLPRQASGHIGRKKGAEEEERMYKVEEGRKEKGINLYISNTHRGSTATATSDGRKVLGGSHDGISQYSETFTLNID